MTNEELDEARAAEAVRLATNGGLTAANLETPARIAARLAREGWEPVDPIVLKAREIVAAENEAEGKPNFAAVVRKGVCDRHVEMSIAIAALRSREP